jgi:Uri superfamily endonuclease
LLRLEQPIYLTVGRLGRFPFAAGWYVYVGSALGGLEARLRRHLRREKPCHWHVDYLREVADLIAIGYQVASERLECVAADRVAALPGASITAPRFGCSDCRCRSHLLHFGAEPDLRLDPSWTVLRPPLVLP